MPLYEYECTSCGHRQEVIQRVGDPPKGTCDECGGKMRRLLSAPSFQFKGSGWYVTDYAGKKSKAADDDGKPVKDKKAGSDSKKTAKAESKGNGGSSSTASPSD